jgi:hypothetical protein
MMESFGHKMKFLERAFKQNQKDNFSKYFWSGSQDCLTLMYIHHCPLHFFPNFRTREVTTSVHEHHTYEKSTTNVNRTYSRTYCFIYIDSCTDNLYYYTQLVLMNCTSVYTTHIYTGYTHTHTDIALYIYIDSFTDILYYCTHLEHMDSTFVYTNVQ